MRGQIIAEPGQDKRRARKSASGDEEGSSVLHACSIARELHDISDGGNAESSENQRTSHLDTVAEEGCPNNNQESQEVWRDGKELCYNIRVSHPFDDGW